MKIKVSRLQIAGLILSLLWVFGAGWYAHNDDVAKADNFVKFADRICSDSVRVRYSTPEKCRTEHDQNVATWMKGDTGNVLFLAIAPLPVFWLIGFCLLYFIRAQVVGFRSVVPWSTLSWQRRTFVVLCFVFATASGLFGVLVLLNNSVESEIPISPTLKSFYKANDGSIIDVVGTWTRTDLTDDTIADPIQTSRILCVKSENRCTEAKGYISGTSLFSDNVEYTVQSWSDSTIVLRNDFMCATEVYTIDLNTEVVSGAGDKTNKDKPFCQSSFNQEGPDHWTLLMEDGFKVYWGERQKRRPWLLRVIQTLSGN